jgi:hypothetical protein
MGIFNKIKNIVTLKKYRNKPSKAEKHIKDIREMILSYQVKSLQKSHKNPLNAYGQKCFSQTDEDGITIEILKRINSINKGVFAEFGVGRGTENNTLILKAQGWNGFWVGNEKLAISYKESEGFYYIKDYITLDNIIALVQKGLKSINKDKVDVASFDLDGNDYYLIETLLKNNFKPKLFIVEYNAKFPPPIKWIMEYNKSHIWEKDDYFGASLSSFNDLFERNEYKLICCNSHTGANAFFIKKEFLYLFNDVPKNIEDLYVEPRYLLHTNFGHTQSLKTINQFFN